VCCQGRLILIVHANAIQCCGSYASAALYDPNNAVCCNDVVIPITEQGQDSCCGSSFLFNSLTQICCGEYPISITQECCGNNQPFDPSTEICCSGSVNPLHGLGTTECCAAVSFDNKCNQCINGVVALGYNEATEMCCEGVIQYKLYEYSCCCGTGVINALDFTCCGGIPTLRAPLDASLCCRKTSLHTYLELHVFYSGDLCKVSFYIISSAVCENVYCKCGRIGGLLDH
jgi:hypothetical protein